MPKSSGGCSNTPSCRLPVTHTKQTPALEGAAVITNRLTGCFITSPRLASKSRAWLCHWLPHCCLYPHDALDVGEMKPCTCISPQLYGLCGAEARGSICSREPLLQTTSRWKWTSGCFWLKTKPLKSNCSFSPSCFSWQSNQWWSQQCEKHICLLIRGRVKNLLGSSSLPQPVRARYQVFAHCVQREGMRGRHHFSKTIAALSTKRDQKG